MVNSLDFNLKMKSEFCEPCVKRKVINYHLNNAHQIKLVDLLKWSTAKIGTSSLGGGQYFLTFVDGYTHYT